MALVDVKKKVSKHAAKLGIDEPVVAACTTNPRGTMTRMLSRELGGAVGSAVGTARTEAADPEHGLAARFPEGQHFLVLTERRLLLTGVAALTGSPKAVVAEWGRDEVVAIEVDKGRVAAPLVVAFVDGTAVCVEGAKGTDPAAVAAAYAAMNR